MKKVIKSNKTGKFFIIEDCASENSLIECLESSEDFEVRDFEVDKYAEDIYDIYIKTAAGN